LEGISYSPKFNRRVVDFKECLEQDTIDVNELRRLSISGVPDSPGVRAETWKLLLSFLPPERKRWKAELQQKREQYRVFCEETVITKDLNKGASQTTSSEEGTLAGEEVTHADHPLSQGTNSAWQAYFKDNEILEQIERDVRRTHPDMHFFNSEASLQPNGAGELNENQVAMRRALFVYAKLNPGIWYVQGMNEVFAPIYYTFKTDSAHEEDRENAEPDAFFCFVELLSDFRDHFCQSLDNSGMGIKASIKKLEEIVALVDQPLSVHLQKENVNPEFYAFRWITLLLTQEFKFPDVVRLWDSLLTESNDRLLYLLRFCCAMLVCVRAELLENDFSNIVKMLQQYPPMDVNLLVLKAEEIKDFLANQKAQTPQSSLKRLSTLAQKFSKMRPR